MGKRKQKKSNGASQQFQNRNVQTNQKLLDIVIPVYQRFDLLQQCLESIPGAVGDHNYSITVFDNGSPKEEADEFYSSLNIENLKVIRSRDNLGFPVACNRAANLGFAPLIFFLNDDVILEPGSVDLLIKNMDDPRIGIVGMKLVFPEYTDLQQDAIRRSSGKLQHIGIETNIRAELYHVFLGWSPNHPKVMAMREVFAVTGAALMTRRNLWKQIGGFNPVYGTGAYEDVEYAMEVRKMGYNIVVDPVAVGTHHAGATAEKYHIGYDLAGNRNIFISRWKHILEWTDWKRL